MAAGTVGEGGSNQSRESTQRPNCARSGALGGGAPAAAAAAKDTTSPYPAVGASLSTTLLSGLLISADRKRGLATLAGHAAGHAAGPRK